jgi:hypothetical protein
MRHPPKREDCMTPRNVTRATEPAEKTSREERKMACARASGMACVRAKPHIETYRREKPRQRLADAGNS